MSILDKLIEKKDLMAYSIFREKALEKSLKKISMIEPEKKREIAKARLVGKIQELRELRKSINMFKKKSIIYSRYVKK